MSLPYELVDKILNLLPVKYLLRCRCVSKEWCSLIDSNAFIKKHFERTLESNPNGGVVISGRRKLFLTDFECLHDENVDVVEMKSRHDGIVVGVANGLVCLCKETMKEFVLCNPSTRKCREIPCEMSLCYGFGYDHVNDDYKFVKIVQDEKKRVEVYSLKTDSWKRLEDIGCNVFIRFRGTYVGGALFWIGFDFSTNSYGGVFGVFGFDLALEHFKKFPIPDLNGFSVCLGHVEGSLCITDSNYRGSHTDVWLMNNHGAENPWCKAFSVEHHALGTVKCSVKPVAFSNGGKDVLLEVGRTKILWYDLEKKAVKDVRVHGIPIKFDTLLYTESLFQLTERKQL